MIIVRNPVLLTVVLAAAVALALAGFVSHAPNRLLSGEPIALWRAGSPVATAAIALLLAILLATAFVPPTRLVHQAALAAATALFLVACYAVGDAATGLAAGARPAARTAPAAGAWVLLLGAALAAVDSLQRLKAAMGARLVVLALTIGGVAAMAAVGAFDALSIAREYAVRREAFAAELARHGELVMAGILPALLLGAVLGLVAARRARVKEPLFAVLNLIQTIPSIALFGLLIAPLSGLAAAVPFLAAIGVRGIGFAPAAIALALYSLLPIARNTEAGVAAVEPAVVEAARAMGFTGRQILWRVEVPLGLPVFLAGLRIALVQAIGLAAVAALIGAGGLGSFVFQGLGQYALDLVLLGAVPTILLALLADLTMTAAIAAARR